MVLCAWGKATDEIRLSANWLQESDFGESGSCGCRPWDEEELGSCKDQGRIRGGRIQMSTSGGEFKQVNEKQSRKKCCARNFSYWGSVTDEIFPASSTLEESANGSKIEKKILNGCTKKNTSQGHAGKLLLIKCPILLEIYDGDLLHATSTGEICEVNPWSNESVSMMDTWIPPKDVAVKKQPQEENRLFPPFQV